MFLLFDNHIITHFYLLSLKHNQLAMRLHYAKVAIKTLIAPVIIIIYFKNLKAGGYKIVM